jgi:hypothetical protein
MREFSDLITGKFQRQHQANSTWEDGGPCTGNLWMQTTPTGSAHTPGPLCEHKNVPGRSLFRKRARTGRPAGYCADVGWSEGGAGFHSGLDRRDRGRDRG